MRAYPRERFSSEVKLTPATVVAFANAAGDDNPIRLEWLVVKVTPNDKLRGRIKGRDGKTAVGAKGRVLVTDRL